LTTEPFSKKVYRVAYFVFRKDVGRKLMALFLAVLVWIYVAQKVVNSEIHRLNIRFVTGLDAFNEESARVDEGFFIVLPENLMDISGTEEGTTLIEDMQLTVTLSGPRERLPSKLIGRKVILSHVHMQNQDTRVVPVNIHEDHFKDLDQSRGIRATFDPPRIDIKLTRRKEHEIVLTGLNNLTTRGELKAELELSFDPLLVTFDPNPVKISGPTPEIDKIIKNRSLFRLEVVDFANVLKDSALDLRPSQEMQQKKISLMTRDNSVRINLHIQDVAGIHELKGLSVLLLDNGQPLDDLASRSMKPDSKTVDLVLSGTRAAFLEFTDEQLRGMFMPVIDLQSRRVSDLYEIKLMRSIDLPDRIRAGIQGDSKMVVEYEEPPAPNTAGGANSSEEP